MDCPSGTVTFLFTDIEGSTRLWAEVPVHMRSALQSHDRIVRAAIAEAGGYVFSTGGDGFAAAFARADRAVAGAGAIQRNLGSNAWPEGAEIRVRVAVHTGEAEERAGDYFGPAVNRTARLMSTAHGGQVLCSAVTAGLVADHLPDGHGLVDLGPHRLRDLISPEQVHQLTGPGLTREFPPLRSLEAYPGNLPVQATVFVGREAEVKELAEAVRETRLITLTGVGGVGKTRLALQVGAEVLPSFRDGAWLVELGGVGDSSGVREAVSSALGISAGPGGAASVEDHLRSRHLLVIVDNCEHLLEPVARLVDAIARTAPEVHVLATSREGLGVSGEHLRTVPSLSTADPGEDAGIIVASDSARLFVERAREADAGYRLADEDAAAVAELCRRLDGIPLAIELAAARVPALTPAEISAHLDRRFKLLTGGRRVAATRHQTLRNAIEWSYQLLDPSEQAVLDRLAVFVGGFDLPAARAVASDDDIDPIAILDIVSRLVAKSLVVAESRAGATRYRLLETVRDFAWERLQDRGEPDAVSRRHAEHFGAFSRDAGAGLRGPEEARWRRRVELDVDNLRAALAWAVGAGEVELALRPVSDLAVFGDSMAPFGLAAETAARLAPDHHLAPLALAAACWAAGLQGDDGAWQLAQESLAAAAELPRTPEGLWVRCRVANATVMTVAVHQPGSETLHLGRRWLADARELGDDWSLCEALTLMAGASGDTSEARTAAEEALALARKLGAPSRIAFAAPYLAATIKGSEPDRARELFEEGAKAAEGAGNDWIEFVAPPALARVQSAAGDRRLAAETVVQTMERWAGRRLSGLVMQLAPYLACLLTVMGDQDGGQLLAGWSVGRGMAVDMDFPVYADFGAGELSMALGRLTAEELQRLVRQAAAFNDRDVTRYGRERLDRLDRTGSCVVNRGTSAVPAPERA